MLTEGQLLESATIQPSITLPFVVVKRPKKRRRRASGKPLGIANCAISIRKSGGMIPFRGATDVSLTRHPLSEVCPALTASTTMRMAWMTIGALSIMMLCPECVSVMCTAPGTSAAISLWAADDRPVHLEPACCCWRRSTGSCRAREFRPRHLGPAPDDPLEIRKARSRAVARRS